MVGDPSKGSASKYFAPKAARNPLKMDIHDAAFRPGPPENLGISRIYKWSTKIVLSHPGFRPTGKNLHRLSTTRLSVLVRHDENLDGALSQAGNPRSAPGILVEFHVRHGQRLLPTRMEPSRFRMKFRIDRRSLFRQLLASLRQRRGSKLPIRVIVFHIGHRSSSLGGRREASGGSKNAASRTLPRTS